MWIVSTVVSHFTETAHCSPDISYTVQEFSLYTAPSYSTTNSHTLQVFHTLCRSSVSIRHHHTALQYTVQGFSLYTAPSYSTTIHTTLQVSHALCKSSVSIQHRRIALYQYTLPCRYLVHRTSVQSLYSTVVQYCTNALRLVNGVVHRVNSWHWRTALYSGYTLSCRYLAHCTKVQFISYTKQQLHTPVDI